MAGTCRLFYTTSCDFLGIRERVFFGLVEGVIRYSPGCENSHVNHSVFVHSFIFGAVTISFFNVLVSSKLFLSKPMSLCFVSPVLVSCCRGMGRMGRGK